MGGEQALEAFLDRFPSTQKQIARIDNHVLWLGAMNKYNKPYFSLGGWQWKSVHKELLHEVHGRIPASRVVVVHCEHATCINMDHWTLCTRQDRKAHDPEAARVLRAELEATPGFSMPEYVARKLSKAKAYAEGWKQGKSAGLASASALITRLRAGANACACGHVCAVVEEVEIP